MTSSSNNASNTNQNGSTKLPNSDSPGERKKTKQKSWARIFLISVFLVLIPVSAILYFKFQDFKRYETEKTFRSLQEIETHIENEIDALEELSRTFVGDNKFFTEQPCFKALDDQLEIHRKITDKNCGLSERMIEEIKFDISDFDGSIDILENQEYLKDAIDYYAEFYKENIKFFDEDIDTSLLSCPTADEICNQAKQIITTFQKAGSNREFYSAYLEFDNFCSKDKNLNTVLCDNFLDSMEYAVEEYLSIYEIVDNNKKQAVLELLENDTKTLLSLSLHLKSKSVESSASSTSKYTTQLQYLTENGKCIVYKPAYTGKSEHAPLLIHESNLFSIKKPEISKATGYYRDKDRNIQESEIQKAQNANRTRCHKDFKNQWFFAQPLRSKLTDDTSFFKLSTPFINILSKFGTKHEFLESLYIAKSDGEVVGEYDRLTKRKSLFSEDSARVSSYKSILSTAVKKYQQQLATANLNETLMEEFISKDDKSTIPEKHTIISFYIGDIRYRAFIKRLDREVVYYSKRELEQKKQPCEPIYWTGEYCDENESDTEKPVDVTSVVRGGSKTNSGKSEVNLKVTLDSKESNEKGYLFLIGIQKEQFLKEMVRSFPPYLATAIFVLVAIIMALMPLIHITLSQPSNSFRKIEYLLAYIGLSTLLVLITAVIVFSISFSGVTLYTENRQQEVEDEIVKQWNDEFAKYANELRAQAAFIQSIKSETPGEPLNENSEFICNANSPNEDNSNLLNLPKDKDKLEKKECEGLKVSFNEKKFHDMSIFVSTDNMGKTATPRIYKRKYFYTKPDFFLNDRQYFKDLKNHHSKSNCENLISFEKIYNYLDARKITQLAAPLCNNTNNFEGIITADALALTISSIVLPHGFKYAIVRADDGLVLYHSEPSMENVENIYREIPDDEFIAAVKSGTDDWIDVAYKTNNESVFITNPCLQVSDAKPEDNRHNFSICGYDRSYRLLIFNDIGPTYSALFQAIVFSWLIHLCALIGGLVPAYLVNLKIKQLPRTEHRYKTKSKFILYLIILATFTSVVIIPLFQYAWILLTVYFFFVFTIYNFFYLTHKGEQLPYETLWRGNYKLIVSSLFALAVFPAILSFAIAYNESITRLEGYETIKVQEQIADRKKHIQKHVESLWWGEVDENYKSALKQASAEKEGIYLEPDCANQIEKVDNCDTSITRYSSFNIEQTSFRFSAPRERDGILNKFWCDLPAFSYYTVLAKKSLACAHFSESNQPTQLNQNLNIKHSFLLNDQYPSLLETTYTAIKVLAQFPKNLGYMVILLLLIFVIYKYMQSIACGFYDRRWRSFTAHNEHDPFLLEADNCEFDKSRFILVDPSRKFLNHIKCYATDVKPITTPGLARKSRRGQLYIILQLEDKRIVHLYENVDQKIEDESIRLRLLEQIEDDVASNNEVWLTTQINPLYRIVQKNAYPSVSEGEAISRKEMIRWANLFKEFDKRYEVKSVSSAKTAVKSGLELTNKEKKDRSEFIQNILFIEKYLHLRKQIERTEKDNNIHKDGDVIALLIKELFAFYPRQFKVIEHILHECPDLPDRVDHYAKMFKAHPCVQHEIADAESQAQEQSSASKSQHIDDEEQSLESTNDKPNRNNESASEPLCHIRDIVTCFETYSGALYRFKWEQCTKEERLLLFQVAKGRIPSTKNNEVIGHLLRRGYITPNPFLKIVSESFRKFILAAEHWQVFEEWEEVAEESSWKQYRLILSVLAFLVLIWLAFTSSEIYQQIVYIVGSLISVTSAIGKGFGFGSPTKSED